jgi:D-glycero-D-manno-heptose 1,7-bisphosphate phosphatase
MKKAIFLDRDGTIIKYVDVLTSSSEIKLLPRAAKAIRDFKNLGFLNIVVTNQPIVARGLITSQGVERLHNILAAQLARLGADISFFYFCPHHPEADILKYRKRCFCRKPAPGLIKRGLRDFDINPKKSFMIGDALIDMAAGKKAGLTTILVKTGPGHRRSDALCKIEPDYVAADLSVAVKIIKQIQ